MLCCGGTPGVLRVGNQPLTGVPMSSAAGVHFGNRLRAIWRKEEAERRKFEDLQCTIDTFCGYNTGERRK